MISLLISSYKVVLAYVGSNNLPDSVFSLLPDSKKKKKIKIVIRFFESILQVGEMVCKTDQMWFRCPQIYYSLQTSFFNSGQVSKDLVMQIVLRQCYLGKASEHGHGSSDTGGYNLLPILYCRCSQSFLQWWL